MHNFTVNAQSTSVIYRKFYRNLASAIKKVKFCTVLPTCQVVIVESLQPKGPAFESSCVLLFHLYSIRLCSFIKDVLFV